MNDPAPARWMQLEIYGHRKLVGQVSETTLAGTSMLKIVVPPTKACPEGFEYIFGGNAIFGACVLDEPIARQIAEQIAATPPRPWTNARMLSPHLHDDDGDGYEQPMLEAAPEDAELEPLGVTDERLESACWICGGAPVTVRCSGLGAVSGPYCEPCNKAGREPIGVLVGSLIGLARDGGDITDRTHAIIDSTLSYYNVTEDELWRRVDAATAAYEAAEAEPPPSEGATDIPF